MISARVSKRILRANINWIIASISLVVLLLVAVLLLAPREAQATAGAADVSRLPALNASLNGVNVILLSVAYLFIRRGEVQRHRALMLSAFGVSVLFLVSYVTYHAFSGSTRFAGPDWVRPFYFSILISHIVLAAGIVPLALITLYRGLSKVFVKHKQIARWTLPIWLYVSVSGVLVYLMLYHFP